MGTTRYHPLKTLIRASQLCFAGKPALAFYPAVVLAAFWAGGESWLIAAALGLPAAQLALAWAGLGLHGLEQTNKIPAAARAIDVATAQKLAGESLETARHARKKTACLLLELEGLEQWDAPNLGGEGLDMELLCFERLRGILRQSDTLVRLTDRRFALFLPPSQTMDLETVLQLCARLQRVIEEPAPRDRQAHYMSASIGFCLSEKMTDDITGAKYLKNAEIALQDAIQNGPGAIRGWSEGMQQAYAAQRTLISDVGAALQNGQVQPWFQPQICTSTGAVTGVEALARWIHPDQGIVPPRQFLRSLEQAGFMARLGEVVLLHSLTALRGWDEAGINIPRVSVNFSERELCNPQLVDRITWELDRFGLTPNRLGIEILETVIADRPDGIMRSNIAGLAKLGCHVDLDDFGTGHASLCALRSFPVDRLKIDRSFVTRVDRDEDQRRLLAAVLGLASRLELQTIAEGVESLAEHSILSQLGCDHVQGYGIARPMPADQILVWAQDHNRRMVDARKVGKASG